MSLLKVTDDDIDKLVDDQQLDWENPIMVGRAVVELCNQRLEELLSKRKEFVVENKLGTICLFKSTEVRKGDKVFILPDDLQV